MSETDARTTVDATGLPSRIPGSSCVLIREGRMEHKCDLPYFGREKPVGMVVRCDCGRRYMAHLISKSCRDMGTTWRRRYLPWPRTPQTVNRGR